MQRELQILPVGIGTLHRASLSVAVRWRHCTVRDSSRASRLVRFAVAADAADLAASSFRRRRVSVAASAVADSPPDCSFMSCSRVYVACRSDTTVATSGIPLLDQVMRSSPPRPSAHDQTSGFVRHAKAGDGVHVGVDLLGRQRVGRIEVAGQCQLRERRGAAGNDLRARTLAMWLIVTA